jgi:hypothetical protein
VSLLSKLFGRRTTEPTKLQRVIERLDPERVMNEAMQQRDDNLRAPAAIALTIVMTAGKFARRVEASNAEARKQIGGPGTSAVSYDVLVFEAAAYCCRQLMRDHLSASEDDEIEDSAVSDDPCFEALRDAAHLTGGLMADYTAFDLPEGFFLNRVISYDPKLKPHNPPPTEWQDFEIVLSCALEGRTPAAGRGGRISLDLALGIALKLNAPRFQSIMVPALLETSRRLYDHDWV